MLLFSVLERALLDLIHNFSRCGTKVDSPKREREKLIRWFLADNRNEYCSFKSICSELSLSHTYLLRALKDKGYL